MSNETVFYELVDFAKSGESPLWHSNDLAIVWANDRIKHLERVNKEWEALWKPIDELVRPLTPLGGSVGDKAVDWIKQGMYYDHFKEMNRTYSEWMGRQKTSLKAQITLQGVAKVAHAGGLYGYGDMGDALTRIREMTIPYWDKVTHND